MKLRSKRQEQIKQRKEILGSLGTSLAKSLIEYRNKAFRFNYVCPSQGHMAAVVGVSRKTANKHAKLLHEVYLVRKVFRGVKRTCRYYIADWLMKDWVLPFLRNLLYLWKGATRLYKPHEVTLLDLYKKYISKKRDQDIATHYANQWNLHYLNKGNCSYGCELCSREGLTSVSVKGGGNSANTITSDEQSSAHENYLKRENSSMKSLYEVPGLSQSHIEELSAFPEPVIDRALGALRKKGKVDFPFTYLRRVCEIFLEEKKKIDVSSVTGVARYQPTKLREDLETGAIRMQAFRVTPRYKALKSNPYFEDYQHDIWGGIDVQPDKVMAMIEIEMQYHAKGDKLCPLSQEMANQTINECPFYELVQQQKEKDEVRD